MLVIYLSRTEIRFCSYTIGKNGNEPGEKVSCRVQLIDGVRSELWWVFTYIAYDRNTQRVFALIKIDGKVYKFTNYALHLRPTYVGLFLGNDPVFTAFQGTTKNFKVSIGDGAFSDS